MELPGNVPGTAFCIDPSGIFVTDLDSAQRFETLASGKLIIHAGEADQRAVGAKLVRADAGSGLALLQADSKEHFAALEIGDSEQLVETMPVIAVGYPATQLHLEDDEYPSLAFSARHISLLHKKKGVLNLIQVDESGTSAGAAGGPMIGSDGKVIGIMQGNPSGFPAISATPSERLVSLMARPIISFSPPALTEAESHAARKFTIGVTWLKKPQGKPTVVFLLNPGDKDQRSVEAKLVKDGVYEVSVVPLEERPLQLHIAAQFSEGNMEAEVADQDIQVGATTIRLSKVLAVDADGPDGSVKAVVGVKTITGKLLGLEKVAATLGGATTTLDLSKATHFRVNPIDRSLAGVHYKITVNVNGVSMEDRDGTIPIKSAPTTAPVDAAVPGIATDKWYYIQSKVSDLYLDVQGARQEIANPVVQADKDPQQVWRLIPSEKDGYYYISSGLSGLCLDVRSDGKEAGTAVDQALPNPTQVWKITPAEEDGWVYIKSNVNGLNLDVYGRFKNMGGKVCVAKPDPAQVWRLVEAPDAKPRFPIVSHDDSSLKIHVEGGSAPEIAVRTEQLGGHGGSEFVAIQPAAGSFIGFRYTTAQWLDKQIIGKVGPIFRSPPPAAHEGDPAPVTIMARDGYVVGGMVVDANDAIVAFKVIFVRYRDGRIDSADTYQSEWCGTPGDRATHQLAGHGETVIGVFGRQGRNLDAMGLVTQSPISPRAPGGEVAR